MKVFAFIEDQKVIDFAFFRVLWSLKDVRRQKS